MNTIDDALRAIEQDGGLEFPDPNLEQRLRLAHKGSAHGVRWSGRTRSPLAQAAGLLLFLTVSGIAVGATVGYDSLRAWWYSIRIDGETVSGVAEHEGPQTVNYVSADGYRVNVRVERRRLEYGAVQTRFEATEQSGGHVLRTSEVTEHSTGPGLGKKRGRTFDLSVLEEASALHTWTTASGERRTLWLGPDFEGQGSWLLLERPDTEVEGPVELLLNTARPITVGGAVTIAQLANGTLEVELSDGHGWEIAFIVGAPDRSDTAAGSVEFTTPSGRVRVQTGD